MRGDSEIMPFSREWNKTPKGAEAASLQKDLLDALPDKDAGKIEEYSGLLCRDAFLAGFRTACNILMPDIPEKGEDHAAQ